MLLKLLSTWVVLAVPLSSIAAFVWNDKLAPPNSILQEAMTDGVLVQHPTRTNLILLGTVHLGSQSAMEVREVIAAMKPDVVVLELSPSRLKTIRSRRRQSNLSIIREHFKATPPPPPPPTFLDTVALLPALLAKGLESAGLAGLLFSSLIMWPGMVRRSWTVKEEQQRMPREDEFVAAVHAADDEAAVKVVACDMELDYLIRNTCQAHGSFTEWGQLFGNALLETVGIRPMDPIRRLPNEELEDWAQRRRKIETARASRKHGNEVAPKVASVLVDQRNELFIEACQKALQPSPNSSSKEEAPKVLCVVGLVHLDGIQRGISQSSKPW